MNSFKIQAQIVSSCISESVYCYLTVINSKEESQNTMELLIYNVSKDSIVINDFNRFILHSSEFSSPFIRQREQTSAFYWDLLTISNHKPKNVVIISYPMGGNFTRVYKKKSKFFKEIFEEKNIDIAIPPDSMFVSKVYMAPPIFMGYPKGYYKLCLYYKKNNKCIAEIIIKKE